MTAVSSGSKNPSSAAGYDNFSPTDPVVNGVTIRLRWYADAGFGDLIDTTPETVRDWSDAPLLVGRSVTDPVTGLVITTKGEANGATFTITHETEASVTGGVLTLARNGTYGDTLGIKPGLSARSFIVSNTVRPLFVEKQYAPHEHDRAVRQRHRHRREGR